MLRLSLALVIFGLCALPAWAVSVDAINTYTMEGACRAEAMTQQVNAMLEGPSLMDLMCGEGIPDTFKDVTSIFSKQEGEKFVQDTLGNIGDFISQLSGGAFSLPGLGGSVCTAISALQGMTKCAGRDLPLSNFSLSGLTAMQAAGSLPCGVKKACDFEDFQKARKQLRAKGEVATADPHLEIGPGAPCFAVQTVFAVYGPKGDRQHDGQGCANVNCRYVEGQGCVRDAS
ncbi:MAG TPA: hypothetical protein DDX54_06695 [Rhodospirillaceae bacterium]|jgi:hypothetical protein|nr:hypothetical protein [Alphaproteobacteria bacterium]HBH27071.1 hypothetical protein [Rhodospirillaceae bacterium]